MSYTRLQDLLDDHCEDMHGHLIPSAECEYLAVDVHSLKIRWKEPFLIAGKTAVEERLSSVDFAESGRNLVVVH